MERHGRQAALVIGHLVWNFPVARTTSNSRVSRFPLDPLERTILDALLPALTDEAGYATLLPPSFIARISPHDRPWAALCTTLCSTGRLIRTSSFRTTT